MLKLLLGVSNNWYITIKMCTYLYEIILCIYAFFLPFHNVRNANIIFMCLPTNSFWWMLFLFSTKSAEPNNGWRKDFYERIKNKQIKHYIIIIFFLLFFFILRIQMNVKYMHLSHQLTKPFTGKAYFMIWLQPKCCAN